MNIKTSFNFTFISILLIVILGFSLYSTSLNNGFIWDDNGQIVGNKKIKSWTNLSEIFIPTKDKKTEGFFRSYRYRPVQDIINMLDYCLWGLNSFGYHLTNLILHISVTLLIYWLMNLLSKNNIVALFSSVFFLIHPIHTEAVAYISGRADPLVAIFLLLGFITYIKHYNLETKRARIISTTLIILLYLGALFTRENGIVLPFLCLIYSYCFKKKINKSLIVILILLGMGYIFLRMETSVFLTRNVPPVSLRIPGFFAAFITYLKLLIFPLDLHMEYGKKLFRYTNPLVISGVGVFFLLVVYAFKVRRRSKLISFSLLWFFVNLIPFSNIICPLTTYMAEHWLYLPSIGFFLIGARFLTIGIQKEKTKKIIVIGIILLVSFYFILTVRQISFWGNPVALYKRILKYNPRSRRSYNNLALHYYKKGRYKKAMVAAKKGLKIFPTPKLYRILGLIHLETKRYKKSIYYYKKALKKAPQNAKIYYNLSVAYYLNRQKKTAAKYLKKSLKLGYDSPKPIILKSLESYMK